MSAIFGFRNVQRRIGEQTFARLWSPHCPHGQIAQFMTKNSRMPASSSRLLSTTTPPISRSPMQSQFSILRSRQSHWKISCHRTGLQASCYSTIPDSYPRNPAAWSKWVVKLLLHWEEPGSANPLIAVGSGFLVNVPGSKKDVIFTAGHNLMDKGGNYAKAVDVIINGVQVATVTKPDEEFYISESYKKVPNDTNPVDDYGCILLPREKDSSGKEKARDGFGFSLPLAFTDLKGSGLSAFVGGYPGILNMGNNAEFRYAFGEFGTVDVGQLFYHATTEQGQSGGPVWVVYKGYETVIGIHNHDEKVEGSGNRATRLDIDTLYDIFKWAGVGSFDKSIKVINCKDPKGLYLKATGPATGGTYARLGKDGQSTLFDIIPAHSAPTDAGRIPRYALVNKPTQDPATWLWLNFNVNPKARPQQVTGRSGVTEDGMVRLHTAGTAYQIEATSLSEKAPSARDPRYLLRIEGKGIPTNIEPGDNNEPESSDVELVDVSSGNPQLSQFTRFRLE